MTKHLDIKIYGQVHDVNFRYFAMQEAAKRGLAGFAENQWNPDSVYIEVEGEEDKLGEFVKACRRGPPHAHIEEFLYSEGVVKNFQDFQIRR